MRRSVLFFVMMLQVVSAISQSDRVDLFDRGLGHHLGFSVGYVTKDWSTDFHDGSDKYHENIWGAENRRMHGMQAGLYYKPISRYGFGGYTGLFCEMYFSSGADYGYDHFTEYNLYLPLHGLLRIPINDKVSVTLTTGLGLYYVMTSEFTNDNEFYYDYDGHRHLYTLDRLNYGGYGWPKRFNAAFEVSAEVNIDMFNIRLDYSYGLTNQNLYPESHRSDTRQHKLGITVGFEFNIDD